MPLKINKLKKCFKNSTGKSSESEVNEDELEEYVRTKYNNFL